jgi:hypothetical protein
MKPNFVTNQAVGSLAKHVCKTAGPLKELQQEMYGAASLRHNGGFYTTPTLKRCLHRKVDFKTNATYNAHVSQLFP